MNRKFILLVSIIALSSAPLLIAGCSSSDEQQQQDQASKDDGLDSGELSEDGGAANPDAVADTSGTPVESAPAVDTGAGDDIVADLGDDPAAESGKGAEELPDQALGNEAGSAVADNNVPPPADAMDAAPPPLGSDTGMTAPKASLKKIKDTPFKSNGRILNTVYVARKGDNINKVAQKLLGDKKRKKDLIADNSVLSRGVKEGDKIYYNSPRRPDDTTTMMTYYEDNGISAQSYVAQEGDDLKKVAKTLLGSKEAWKELWVTNPNVESKGSLSAGTEIRYWPAQEESTVAANTPPPPAQEPPPPVAAGTTAPPPPDLSNLPPPSDSMPPPPMETAGLPPPPPPPPPDQNVAANALPPPPPPPPQMMGGINGKKPASPESLLFQDQETTMALGAGAVVLLSVILLLVIRIKKSRAQRMRLGQTQV